MGLERKAGAKSCRNNQAMYRIQIRAMGSHGGLYAASAINRIMIYKDFSDFCMQNSLGYYGSRETC